MIFAFNIVCFAEINWLIETFLQIFCGYSYSYYIIDTNPEFYIPSLLVFARLLNTEEEVDKVRGQYSFSIKHITLLMELIELL